MSTTATDPLMTTQELSDYLKVPLETVYRWRRHREGPVGFKVGRHVRFRRSDVERWLAERVDDPAPAA